MDFLGVVLVFATIHRCRIFAEQTTYDEYGWVFQQFDASGDDHGLRYVYANGGHGNQLKEAREGTSGTVYYDANGQPWSREAG